MARPPHHRRRLNAPHRRPRPRHHVEWSIVWRDAASLLPTGFIGLAILNSLSPAAARGLIGVLGLAGFAYAQYAGPLLLLAVAVVVGTWIGSKILGHVTEIAFTRLYKSVLTIVALRLGVGEGLSALGVG